MAQPLPLPPQTSLDPQPTQADATTAPPVPDFSSIPGHQIHDDSTIGPEHGSTAKTISTTDEFKNAPDVPLDPQEELGNAVGTVLSKIENYTQQGRAQHPILSRLGDAAKEAQEFLVGGTTPMGPKEGIVNNPVTQTLTMAEDAPKMGAAAEELAGKVAGKVGEHLAETGRNLLESTKEDFHAYKNARAPEGSREAGKISIKKKVSPNFSELEGHELVKAAPKEEPEPEKTEPNPQVAASAQRFNASHGQPNIDHSPVPLPEDTDRHTLADAYDKATHEPNNTGVQRAYQAMKQETKDQFNHMVNDLGIKVDFTEKDPYHSAEDMQADVRNNHHLSVYTGGEVPKDHPLAEMDKDTGQSYNNLFRATHDVFGHSAGGFPFTEEGEHNAFNAHNQMYSDTARPAVRTETLGQSNWFFNNEGVRSGREPLGKFPEQKATILPLSGKVDESANGDIPESQQAATQPEPQQPNILQRMAEQYGTSNDASKVRRGPNEGASFIQPDGKFIHLPGTLTHDSAIAMNDDGTYKNADDVRVGVINDTGAVRLRLSNDRAGPTLHVSVPPETMTEDQIQPLKDAIRSTMPNGRGNLVVETATNPLNIRHETKEFATANDVEPMLRKIGAHPNDWTRVASKMMDESPAGAVDPRTGDSAKDGFGVEVFPEARAAREPLDHKPTREDLNAFHDEHKELFDRHPELRVGWDQTDKGWELNVGASAPNQAGAELVGRKLDQRSAYDIANGKEIPTGGVGEKTKFNQYKLEDRLNDLNGVNVAKLPPTIKNSPHLTDEEKYLLGSNSTSLRDFKSTRKKIASVKELAETMKGGEANRFWYDRAKASFDSMFDVLPKGSFPEADRDKFIGLVAATSPRSDVTENLASALSAYKAWVQEGRPTNPETIREVIDSSLMMPGGHGPNSARALTGQELSGPKVRSFLQNFMGSAKHVTNDMWGAITNGIVNPSDITSPGAYIALSENYRKAAESLGWTPQQGQAASWGFIRTLGNASGFGGKMAGKDRPASEVAKLIDDPLVRKYSADIADLFLTSPKVRERLESLGIDLEKFDDKLNKSIAQYGRGTDTRSGDLNPQLIAKSAKRVEAAKDFAREQAQAGKSVNEKAMPLLNGVLTKQVPRQAKVQGLTAAQFLKKK